MKDKKDMSERIKYFEDLKHKFETRKHFYIEQIKEINQLLEFHNHEKEYNLKWIKFHENGIEGHKKTIQETSNPDIKKDQELKLKWHIKQIKEHHLPNVDFHTKEIEALKKELKLFQEGIERMESNIKLVEKRMKENMG